MNELSSKSKIAVALHFGPQAVELVKNAYELAKQFKCELLLVNVIEPFNSRYLHTLYGIPAIQAGITARIDDERKDAAMVLLEKEIKNAPEGLKVTAKSIVGDVEEALLDVCSTEQVDAIIIGSKNSYNFFESSMSTTTAIMDKSRIPVIVFPRGSSFKTTDSLKLLVCDDFSESGSFAVDYALSIAQEYPQVSVNHFNVIDHELLEENEQIFKYLEPDFEKVEKYAESDLVTKVSEKLTNNFFQGFDFNKQPVRYKPISMIGDTYSCISKTAKNENIDLILFGEHAFLKLSPFGSGTINWRSMVTFGKPIVVCKS